MRGFNAYLFATAVACGALVMVIEVLGSRVIGPFFGVSLFVWTSLISVTLVALAAGYAVGGRWADRHGSPDALYLILLAAGLLVLAIPALRIPVLKASQPLGLRLGALASASVLFGPPLFLLGCVSPYVVRLAATELRTIGRTVGGYYAASTAGSVAGTVLTGFFLLAWLGVNGIFWACGSALLLLAVVYFAGFRRKWLALLALVVPWLAWPQARLAAAVTPDGTRVSVVRNVENFYGSLKVIDYRYGATHTRELTIDGLVQGGVDVSNGLSVYEYPYLLQYLPRAMHPRGRRCLVIGLGAGVVPGWYQRQGVATDVVDIDPDIVRLAREYFGFRPGGRVYVQDARSFLAGGGQAYDYVIVDVFNGDTTPAHLLTVEAMRLVKSRLSDGGIAALNLVGSLKSEAGITAAATRTLREVFDNVAIYPVFPLEGAEPAGKLVIIAYDGPPRPLPQRLPDGSGVHPFAEQLVRAALANGRAAPQHPQAVLVTDDFNPVDLLDLRLKEQMRKGILDTTPADILL